MTTTKEFVCPRINGIVSLALGKICPECGDAHWTVDYQGVTSGELVQLLTDYKSRCSVHSHSRGEDERHMTRIDTAIRAVRENRIIHD